MKNLLLIAVVLAGLTFPAGEAAANRWRRGYSYAPYARNYYSTRVYYPGAYSYPRSYYGYRTYYRPYYPTYNSYSYGRYYGTYGRYYTPGVRFYW